MLFSSLWIYISLNNPCSIHPPLPTPRQLYWDVVDIYCWVSLRCTGVDLIHLHIAVLATTLVLADTIMSHNYLLYFFQWKICWHMTLWKCLFFLHVGGSFCCVCNYRFSVISFSTLRLFSRFRFPCFVGVTSGPESSSGSLEGRVSSLLSLRPAAWNLFFGFHQRNSVVPWCIRLFVLTL